MVTEGFSTNRGLRCLRGLRGHRCPTDIRAGREDQGCLPTAENKLWHGHPVWLVDGNPVAGHSVRKAHVQLLFWSGQSFDEPGLRSTG